MTIDTLVVPKKQATAKLDAYRRELKRRRKPIDDEISRLAQAYEVAAQGTPVIQLSQAIAAGGMFDNGLPRIAIARSDKERVSCEVSYWRQGFVRFEWPQYQDPRRSWTTESLDVRTSWPRIENKDRNNGQTIVPLVPPEALQEAKVGRTTLRRYMTLFEVEEWTPVPPTDPALLQHIAGDLYAVLAVWNLTALEMAVIAGTR